MVACLTASLGSAAGLATFSVAGGGVAGAAGVPPGLARTSLPLSISLSLPGLLMLTSLEPRTPGLAAAGGTLAGMVGRSPSLGGVHDFAPWLLSGRERKRTQKLLIFPGLVRFSISNFMRAMATVSASGTVRFMTSSCARASSTWMLSG